MGGGGEGMCYVFSPVNNFISTLLKYLPKFNI